ncbi:EAL domain-containing protein [Oricola indica]|uniref:EAL domain-containing protein n=1 Tax=Oricola indica TaxID=2872591 RepID=UPI003CCC2EDB
MADTCEGCRSGEPLGFDFTMAFQPIVETSESIVWGYEALIRGTAGEGAGEILSRVGPEQRYRFDQACRVKAVELPSRLFPKENTPRLSINFLPNAVYEPAACLRKTLSAARRCHFPQTAIMFEFTENEIVHDTAHLRAIIAEYRKQGFVTAIDDFGAGFSGLALLADFQPDLIKLDMHLVRDIHASRARQAIVAGLAGICRELDIALLAEGVESEAEFLMLKAAGVTLFQGYWFAPPAVEALPQVSAAAISAVNIAA